MNFSFKRKLVKIKRAIDNLSILILINVVLSSLVSALFIHFDVLNYVVLGVFFSFVFVLDFVILIKLNEEKLKWQKMKWKHSLSYTLI